MNRFVATSAILFAIAGASRADTTGGERDREKPAADSRVAVGNEPFTPVKASIRYRKIGVYGRDRLAGILEGGLDTFLGGASMKRGDFKGSFVAPRPQDAAWVKGCINNMIWAYEEYSGMPGFAASAIKPEYLAASRRFYEGQLDWTSFNAGLPEKTPDMLEREFLVAAESGQGRFWKTVDGVEAYRWKVMTPLRSYAGDADEAIPAEISRLASDFNRLLGGGKVESFSAGERADHRSSFVQATLDVKPWFDGFVKPAAP